MTGLGKLSAPSSKKLSEIAVASVVAAVSTVTGPRGPDDPPFVLGSSLPHRLSSALTAFAALLSVIVVWLSWTRGDEVAKLQDGFDTNTPCTLAAWAMRALGLTHDELPPEVIAVSDDFSRDFIPVSTMHRKDAGGPMHGPGGALSLLAVTRLGGTVVDGQGALTLNDFTNEEALCNSVIVLDAASCNTGRKFPWAGSKARSATDEEADRQMRKTNTHKAQIGVLVTSE